MTQPTKPRLILGSSSPRRLELLKQIHIVPDMVQGADTDETPRKGELPSAYCMRVAREKNAALVEKFPHDFILTADTTVALGRRIFGKAEDEAEAARFIKALSGRAHHVFTAVVLRAPDGRLVSRLCDSRVKVKRLSDAEIAAHIATKEWQGKAGAYMVQGDFARYIIGINGSPSSIIGLPLYETAQLLRGLGYVDDRA